MRDHEHKQIWFNFGHLGHPGWTPVTLMESRLMLRGAEDLVQANPEEACEIMIARSTRTLQRLAQNYQVTDHWISLALLVTAMTGVLGHAVPDAKICDTGTDD